MKIDATGQRLFRKAERPFGRIFQGRGEGGFDFVVEARGRGFIRLGWPPVFPLSHVAFGPAGKHPGENSLADQEFIAVCVTDKRRLEH